MTLTEVKNFYGSLDNAAKAINVGSGILGFTEHLAPMVQMMFYVASKGQLAFDEHMQKQLTEVVKVMFCENEE